MSRPCVQQNFVSSCGFHAFISRVLCLQVQIFEFSPGFRALIRLRALSFYLHSQNFLTTTKFSCFYVKTFVRSRDFLAMTRLWCIYAQIFMDSSPDICAFNKILRLYRIFFRSSPDFVLTPKFCALNEFFCTHMQNSKTFFRSYPLLK